MTKGGATRGLANTVSLKHFNPSVSRTQGKWVQELKYEPYMNNKETDGNLSVIEQLVVNHLHNRNGTSTEIGIVYTPSTPAPENINCFVEVPTTTRVGGRCIQLGSIRGRSSRNSPWACQAGVHLAITQECQRSRARPRSGRRRGGSG